jgi:peptidoglycan/xylan/chitin deacetylase (PgdA/CDA1 family)
VSASQLAYDWPLILAYHSVGRRRRDALAVRPDAFQRQMAWLRRRGYRSLTLADFLSRPVSRGERVVVITFDDGYADNYVEALPILREHGFVATVFLVSDYVNSARIYPWDLAKAAAEGDAEPYRVLTWPQVGEMAACGIELGSHTCTHPELTTTTGPRCWDEVARSRRDLAQRIGRDVVSFSYPRGDLSGDVARMVEEAGYAGAVVTPPRPGIPLTRYTLRRVGVYQNTSPLLFRLKATGWVRLCHERLGQLRAARRPATATSGPAGAVRRPRGGAPW